MVTYGSQETNSGNTDDKTDPAAAVISWGDKGKDELSKEILDGVLVACL